MNLIKYQQPFIEKNYLYINNSFRSKYQFLIEERVKVGVKNYNIQKH